MNYARTTNPLDIFSKKILTESIDSIESGHSNPSTERKVIKNHYYKDFGDI